MEFVRGQYNSERLINLNKEALVNCTEVWAAVAYVTAEEYLINPCYKLGIPLKFWARHDHTLPVRTDILQSFISRNNPQHSCKLVSEMFHPKVIWWKGYGAYIGSANMTKYAWYRNVEAGTFLTEFELEDSGMRDELEDFFYMINELSDDLTQEWVNEILDYEKSEDYKAVERARRKFEEREEKRKGDYRINSLAISKEERKKRINSRRSKFLKEWNQTLEYLRGIAKLVSEDKYRPTWCPADASPGVQADQFLHAYYYRQVRKGSRSSQHKEIHKHNKVNPVKAREDAMLWWKQQSESPETDSISEEQMIKEWAPFLSEKLAKDKLRTLNEDEFVEVMSRCHAFRTYAAQNAKNEYLGFPKDSKHSADVRIDVLARRVFNKRALNGNSPMDMLHELLYGGSTAEIPSRLFEAANDREKKIPHMGLGTLGELVGWAIPDTMPPRNGRSSKALYALGYDVEIYGGDKDE